MDQHLFVYLFYNIYIALYHIVLKARTIFINYTSDDKINKSYIKYR